MRVVNEYVVGLAEDFLDKKGFPPPIIYSAPTGYGKTCTAPRIYLLYRDAEAASSHIHVLPMRSLVEKIYSDMYGGRGCFSGMPGAVNRSIGYQSMDRLSGLHAPFFLTEITVTTIDSYLYNLLRVPVAEHGQEARHYAAPRLSIFTGLNVLDEAHLYGGDPGVRGDMGVFAAYSVALVALRRSRTPLLVLSATLPSSLLRYLASRLGGDAVIVEYEPGPERVTGSHHLVGDEEFDSMASGVKWVNKVIGSGEIIDIVADHVARGDTVMVVRNTPEKAVETYDRLVGKGVDAVLLHGRMSMRDRREAMERLGSARVLVATQVVEAGIDVSFDVLVSDIAAPSALVQRAGRINRWFKRTEAYVYIVGDAIEYSGMYSGAAMEKALAFLRRRGVNWRYAGKRCGELYGYKLFLEETSSIDKAIREAMAEPWLHDLVSAVAVSNELVTRLLHKLCVRGRGLVRSTIMAPVYVGDIDEVEKGLEEGDVVAVSMQYAVKMIDRLRWSDGQIRLVYAVRGGGYVVENTRSLDYNLLCSELLRLGGKRLAAIAAPPGIYTRGRGLVFPSGTHGRRG